MFDDIDVAADADKNIMSSTDTDKHEEHSVGMFRSVASRVWHKKHRVNRWADLWSACNKEGCGCLLRIVFHQ